jgi:hypothetical protein
MATNSALTSNFPAVTELPTANPQVILAFHGLMSLLYSDLGYCEVAIHNAAPQHNFSISIFDDLSATAQPFFIHNFGHASSSPVDVIRFDVINADPVAADVRFFQPVNFRFGTATRARIVEDPFDFRLLNDFEGPEFYSRSLDKKRQVFRPRVFIKSGIFLTLVPSEKSFKRQAPFDSLRLGPIAHIVGAGIYLRADGFVSLRIAQEEVTLRPTADKLYLIVFDNSCDQQVCNFVPSSPIKERRNDFFEYYKMFTIPDDKEEFELLLEPAAPTPTVHDTDRIVPTAYTRAAGFLKKLAEKLSSNDAPCGPVGYGGGN